MYPGGGYFSTSQIYSVRLEQLIVQPQTNNNHLKSIGSPATLNCHQLVNNINTNRCTARIESRSKNKETHVLQTHTVCLTLNSKLWCTVSCASFRLTPSLIRFRLLRQ